VGDKKFNYYDFGFGGKALSIYDNFHFFLISSGGLVGIDICNRN
jgi:hypothetical protein